MITRLDHIAIAVPNLEKAIQRFANDLGIALKGQEDVIEAKTSTAFFPIDGTQIELVHPLNNEGPIKRYIDKQNGRGGLHHICFATDDIDADVAKLKAKGYQFTSEAPTPGAHDTRVIFIHPKSTEGILIELAEYPKEDTSH